MHQITQRRWSGPAALPPRAPLVPKDGPDAEASPPPSGEEGERCTCWPGVRPGPNVADTLPTTDIANGALEPTHPTTELIRADRLLQGSGPTAPAPRESHPRPSARPQTTPGLRSSTSTRGNGWWSRARRPTAPRQHPTAHRHCRRALRSPGTWGFASRPTPKLALVQTPTMRRRPNSSESRIRSAHARGHRRRQRDANSWSVTGHPSTSDRAGPECREMFGDSVNSPLPQDISVLISAERLRRPSAN